MLRSKPQAVVGPIVVIAIGGLVALLITLITGSDSFAKGNPMPFLLGIVFSMVVATVGTLYLHWLDRWEPEPPLLLASAFFWGGGVALILVILFTIPLAGIPEALSAAVVAPLTEESAKGLFLVVVLLASRRGRSELNSLTDALVYAGFIGIGFSFVEDMMYIAGGETAGEAAVVMILRGLGAFSHSVYTGMTAIGVWRGINSTGAMRYVWPFLGWCAAVFLHAMHNGSTLFGLAAVLIAMVVFDLGGFIFYLVMGLRSRKQEKAVVGQQLHPMVNAGWVSPAEAQWLSSLTQRRARMSLPHMSSAEQKRLRGFRDDATELAFVRARLDEQARRGRPLSKELLTQHDQLVAQLRASQEWVNGRLPPAPTGWTPPPPGVR
ncbi:PrsW family intramembrane metalloprotease [Mariniluteicoccus endophyticus]